MKKSKRSQLAPLSIHRHPTVRRALDAIADDAIAQLTLDLAHRADLLLDDIPLDPLQRARLYAYDRTQMPFVIQRTYEAIADAPHLYPDVPPPALLRRRLGSAHRLHSLRSLLSLLHDRVDRLYHLAQGEASELSLQVLRGAREGYVVGLSPADLDERKTRPFLAEHALRRTQPPRPKGRPTNQ